LKVLAVGATGSIGHLVVEEAIRQGHTVRALARDRQKARRLPKDAEVMLGDLTRPETLARAIEGLEAIVFTHGSDGRGKNGAEQVDYGGVRNVLAALTGADWFTGSVRIDAPFQRPAPARIGGATVTFQPGARTAWHTHPLGQTLIVTAGCGRVQQDGGPIEEVHAGDIVWFGPGERHWHGASPAIAMTHIAIAEMLDGKVVEWMEHVTDEQYGK
jgi:quercetin dioxygenase-like cupin family protein